MLLNKYDFLPRFLQLALVNILSNITVPLSGLISVAFLGHLPEISNLAGVALATILYDWLFDILVFLRMGTTGVTAQAVGRDDKKAVTLVLLRSGVIALGLGLLIVMLQYPLREVGFALLAAPPDVKASGMAYFNASIWAAPAILLNNVLLGWFLGREENGKVLLLSVVGNAAKVALDYLFIARWGWNSAGAGLSLLASQYLILFGGLIFVCLLIRWEELRAVAGEVLNLPAFQSTITLNGNILVSNMVHVFSFTIFNWQSVSMGITAYTENALLLQILTLTLYFVEGLGYSLETLTGNFKGKGSNENLELLIGIAGGTSLLFGLSLGLVCIVFPQAVFGLLTNHTEVTEHINIYTPWLLPVLGFGSVSFMLEGYFLGLAEGNTIRTVSLIALGLGFAPIATAAAWQFHSNHILWLALSAFFAIKMLGFVVQIPRSMPKDVALLTRLQNRV